MIFGSTGGRLVAKGDHRWPGGGVPAEPGLPDAHRQNQPVGLVNGDWGGGGDGAIVVAWMGCRGCQDNSCFDSLAGQQGAEQAKTHNRKHTSPNHYSKFKTLGSTGRSERFGLLEGRRIFVWTQP